MVTISVPVSTVAVTVLPLTASNSVWSPRDPIFDGNWATDPASSPAMMAVISSGEASKPTTVILPLAIPAFLIAWSAPMIGGPHAP